MANNVQKITLSGSRDIPFNKLVLSQSNVRRIKAGVSVEELAEDIARRTLLQSLNVRPVLDAEGTETGMFEIPAGGRRYQALALLVKQKRLAKTALIPCVVRDPATSILAEDDSLAENVQRVALHPLDQFRAFQTLREKGQSDENIAAAFFVSVNIVKQRPRLTAVTPRSLCRRRDVAGATHGLHRDKRPRPSGTGLGIDPEILVEGPLPDPPHADGARGPGQRQARGFRRPRRL
jgi:ParB family chromosome partitioning protein